MKKHLYLPCHASTILIFLLLASVADGRTRTNGIWATNYKSALSMARMSRKDVLIVFTTRNRSAACRHFEKHFLLDESFTAGAGKNYVLVWLDSSEQGGDKQDTPAFRLRKKYEVNSFPTVILSDGWGRPYAYTGLRPGSLANFLQHLDELRELAEVRRGYRIQAERKQGLEQARLLSQALPELGRTRTARFYQSTIRRILKLDPAAKLATTRTYAEQLADFEYSQRLAELQRELRWLEMVKVINEHIRDHNLTGARKQAALMDRLAVHHAQDNLEAVFRTLTEIIQINSYSRHGQQASLILNKLTSDLQQQEILANPSIAD